MQRCIANFEMHNLRSFFRNKTAVKEVCVFCQNNFTVFKGVRPDVTILHGSIEVENERKLRRMKEPEKSRQVYVNEKSQFSSMFWHGQAGNVMLLISLSRNLEANCIHARMSFESRKG